MVEQSQYEDEWGPIRNVGLRVNEKIKGFGFLIKKNKYRYLGDFKNDKFDG